MSDDIELNTSNTEELAAENGIDSEQAVKLVQDIAKIIEDQGDNTPSPEVPLLDRVKTALASAGVPDEMSVKILESIPADALPLSPETINGLVALFKKLLSQNPEAYTEMIAGMQAAQAKWPANPPEVLPNAPTGGLLSTPAPKSSTDDTTAPPPAAPAGETILGLDVMEPISADKEFIKKLKKVLKASKLPKSMHVLVMEPISADAMEDKCKVTDSLDFTLDEASITITDGVLKSHAVCAAAMVQDYSGTKMLKCPDELKLAVQFARMIPITDGHPPEALVRNQNEIKGWTGILSWNDKDLTIECDIEITDAPLVAKVKSGKRDLSIGFCCEIDPKKGTYTRDGGETAFDAIQRNIILNHVAAGIDKGRCPAPICGIKTDEEPPATLDPDVRTMEIQTPAPETAPESSPEPTETDAPLTPEERRAIDYFKMTEEAWKALSETEKAELLEKPPKKEEEETKTETPDPNAKSDAETLAEAQNILAEEKGRLIDSIMDFNPPKPRSFFEAKNIVALRDIKELLATKQTGTGLDSSSFVDGKDAIDDAYANLHRKKK